MPKQFTEHGKRDRARDTYLLRMQSSPQFKRFGLVPEWRPGEGDISGFCRDEVIRQYHDPRKWDDGGIRVKWLLNAWDYALNHRTHIPDMSDIKIVAANVEPKFNTPGNGYVVPGGFRVDNVWIGDRKGAPPIKLAEFVEALVAQADRLKPGPAEMALFRVYTAANFTDTIDLIKTIDDWYLAYEWIHPWPDGNGRSGKILHNWLSGALTDPVLVPDYFNGGNP